MIFYQTRVLFTGIMIGVVLMALSNDYIIVSRRKYEKLKNKKGLNHDDI